MLVKVYRNLRTKCWSIKQKNKVVSHQNTLILKDVMFRVSEKGRQRVLARKQKNVHAYVCGSWIQEPINLDLQQQVLIKYDPYKQGTFFKVEDNSSIYKADFVIFAEQGRCYAVNPS
jgi:5'(3')-deoxyribonucleotidase